MALRFSWDPRKAAFNLRKHGISFDEAAASGGAMKKTPSRVREVDTMRAEYDFTGGIRGKYAKRYASGTNVVLLEPDIAEAFPTARAVNAALRKVLRASPSRPGRAPRRSA